MMADGIDLVAGLVEREVMDVHRDFSCASTFLAAGSKKRRKPSLSPPAAEQPVAPGVKSRYSTRPASLALELAEPLALSPVEDFDPGLAVQVVDVGDLADAADGESRPVGREGQ